MDKNLLRILAENAAAEIMGLWWMKCETSIQENIKASVLADIIERRVLEEIGCDI